MSRVPEQYRADIAAAAAVLRRGGVILYPTDTVWGLGCDARNTEAVERIYRIKGRDDSKALITLVGSMAMLDRTVEEVPEAAEQLIEAAVDPVTIVYDRARGVSPRLTAPDGSIGVRLTRETFSAALCNALGAPLVSTSANLAGAPTPAVFVRIAPEILEAVDYVCTSRREEDAPHRPSAVIKISAGGLFKILRK